MKKEKVPSTRKQKRSSHITVTCNSTAEGLPCIQQVTLNQTQLGIACPRCGAWVTANTEAYRARLKSLLR